MFGLDSFNFKFNYKQVSGRRAIWAGPVMCRFGDFQSAQAMRDERWSLLETSGQFIEDAGWHFSYLTSTGDLSSKLQSFSHQEGQVQKRASELVETLIERREGFLDNVDAGSVWAPVALSTFECATLATYVQNYPRLLIAGPVDSDDDVRRRVRRSVAKIYSDERGKIIMQCSAREIVDEIIRRLKRVMSR